jgi:hypothetical protein
MTKFRLGSWFLAIGVCAVLGLAPLTGAADPCAEGDPLCDLDGENIFDTDKKKPRPRPRPTPRPSPSPKPKAVSDRRQKAVVDLVGGEAEAPRSVSAGAGN